MPGTERTSANFFIFTLQKSDLCGIWAGDNEFHDVSIGVLTFGFEYAII